MNADAITVSLRPPLRAGGRHRPRGHDDEERGDRRRDRGRHQHDLERDEDRDGLARRRRGKHGCDRIRGQGTRRRLD